MHHIRSAKSSAGCESGDEASGDTDTAADAGTTELTTEARWRKSWAFATSPHGLAISTPQFWRLTSGLYAELKRQWQYGQDRIAIPLAWIRADLHNAWMHEKGRPAKSALDFLPGRKPVRQAWKADMAVFAAVADSKGYSRPRPEDREAALERWLSDARKRRESLQAA